MSMKQVFIALLVSAMPVISFGQLAFASAVQPQYFAAAFTTPKLAVVADEGYAKASADKVNRSAYSSGSPISSLGISIAWLGVLTTGIGVVEMGKGSGFVKDGTSQLAAGIGLMAAGVLITKLGADYENKHPGREHYSYHSHHYHQQNWIRKNPQGFLRVYHSKK